MREAGFPLDNPALKYLVIGWGSKAFYTSTKDYSDIKLSTIWQASTGDQSVMHVSPAGELAGIDDLVRLKISEKGFARLVSYIGNSFVKSETRPVLIPGATFGFGDLFYESPEFFSLLTPCNVWVSQGLREAGLASGVWTPTTYSLLLNHYLYN